ncbi:hypothetical protein [Kribbella sindirgiensis]|uniref:Uncharacterized protein n=1 Tax=Kribbella sindirgiensis TaxID=1124744 RepID=A0A4R0I0N6_9ACTN|nr:hypothetical protein [Kribbella sindirgiensis]TCC18629.1 hypothetical protein E0H50_38570 [Kribbella sindirgiensis]
MNFFLPGTNGPYTGCTDVQAMYDDLDGQKSGPWRAHAQRWTDAGTALHTASGELRTALNKVTIWQQSTGSEGWTAFRNEVTDGVNFLETWNGQTAAVAQRLNRVAEVLDGARGVMRQLLDAWNAGKQKANSSEDPVIRAGLREMDSAALAASIEMNIMSAMLGIAFDGLQAEFSNHDWKGPVVAKPAAGGPQSQQQDQGGGGAEQAKAGDAQTKADEKAPDEKKPEEKKPEAKDPVEEAGKLIDVVGKGIDLVGKVPENLDKWLTLAQHAKDLVDPGTTATTTTDPTKSLPTDQPALAGGSGTTTAPTFHASASPPPATSSGSHLPIGSLGGGGVGALGNSGHVPGTSERATPVQKSATVAGTAGAEPTLSGKTSSAAVTSSQQSTPPMYPPQSGGMGAGGNGVRDVKPGAGTGRRPGFNVPAEQSETERLRRHGVQSDLQGRSNGESRTAAGVPPLRKRKRTAARPAEREVLDEDLWRL